MTRVDTKKRATQADVASYAGVSQATVSYVVNSSPVSIPRETHQRIMNAMDALGYTPNITARRLRTSKTATIAGIIPDITNPFYPAFERGVQDITDKENFDLIIYNTDGRAEKEKKVVSSLLQGRVDGVAGVFFHLTAKDLLPLIEQNIAVVRLEATLKQPGNLPLDNIYVDNVAAARAAVEHLIQKGHTRIGILAGRDGPSSFRLEGYKQSLLNNHTPCEESLICKSSYDEEGGYTTMQVLLRLTKPPTAIFAANDLMAMGAMLAIREAGLTVPDDVAVVGFDDIPSAKLINPALSSVNQQQRHLGQRAAQMLFERLKGEIGHEGRSEAVPFKLEVRASSEKLLRKELTHMT